MSNKIVFSSFGVVLTVALSACVTPLPQPNGLTRAAESLAAPNNQANVTDKSPPNRSVASAKPSTLQKPSIAPIVAQVPQNSGSGVLTGGGQPDWTKLFKSWEKACTNSPEFEAFEAAFTVYDEKLFRSKLAKINLPAIYKAATGIPTAKVGSTGEYTEFTLPVTAGTYYGIPVKAIQIYRGHENGITSHWHQDRD